MPGEHCRGAEQTHTTQNQRSITQQQKKLETTLFASRALDSHVSPLMRSDTFRPMVADNNVAFFFVVVFCSLLLYIRQHDIISSSSSSLSVPTSDEGRRTDVALDDIDEKQQQQRNAAGGGRVVRNAAAITGVDTPGVGPIELRRACEQCCVSGRRTAGGGDAGRKSEYTYTQRVQTSGWGGWQMICERMRRTRRELHYSGVHRHIVVIVIYERMHIMVRTRNGTGFL